MFLSRMLISAFVLCRMPVQYVIEEWDFRDLTLKMRPPVFIPRPETEAGREKNRPHIRRMYNEIPMSNQTWPELCFLCVLVQELVELVLTDLEMKPGTGAGGDAQHTCLEVGCGSGAISLSLLKNLPQVRFVFIEGSKFLGTFFDSGWKVSTSIWMNYLESLYIHGPQRWPLDFSFRTISKVLTDSVKYVSITETHWCHILYMIFMVPR